MIGDLPALEVEMTGPIRDPETKLMRRYKNALGQTIQSFQADLARIGSPVSGGLLEIDKADTGTLTKHKQRQPRLHILNLSMQHCAHKLANVQDHMVGIRSILDSEDVRPYTPTSLVRVAVEAATGVHYLLDSAVTLEERTLRAAALLLESFNFEVKAAREMPTVRFPHAAPAMEKCREKLLKVSRKAGLDVRVKANGLADGIRWDGAPKYRGMPPEKITDLVRTAFSDLPGLYQFGSGVAHSMAWMLDDNASRPDDGSEIMQYTGSIYTTGAVVTTAITAVEVVLTAFATYMGNNPESVLPAHRRRREAVDKLMGDYAASRLQTFGRL